MDVQMLGRLDADPVDWRYKSFPITDPPIAVGEVANQGWNVLRGDFDFPVMTLERDALVHNIALLSRWCDEHGVMLAPHGKTTMSPEILKLQLDAGAWGVTAATVSQVRTWRTFGVNRILLANELLERSAISWVASEISRHPDSEFMCLVDSVDGVRLMTSILERLPPGPRLKVLIEVGHRSGRAGLRTLEHVMAVSRALARSHVLELAGVEAFEGVIRGRTMERTMDAVDSFLDDVANATVALARSGAFDHLAEVTLSAGGSAFVDRVVGRLSKLQAVGRTLRLIVRSGCYVTHDSLLYERLSPFGARADGNPHLRPALEVWGVVLSRPEPGRAIVGFGKRDVSYDLGMPIPRSVVRRSGNIEEAPPDLVVNALDDQHAYMDVGEAFTLEVGDIVRCGISHPCTAFDKWRLLPVIDSSFNVIGAVHTFF